MLRRWIPILGVLAVLLLAAEPASARLRDRLANRRGYSDAPVYYQATPTATVTTSEFVPATAEPVYSERPSRRFGRRAPVNSGGAVYTPTVPAGAATGPMPDTERTSFYPSTAPSNAVLLKVRLPADAELRIEGKRMTFARATGRHFAKYISALLQGLGFIIAAFTAKRQALHDMIAETVVIKR